MPDILHQLTVKAPPERVYRALTEQAQLARWWTTDTVAAPEIGSIAEFGFGRRATVIRMRIEELVPASRVRWRCVGGIDEWTHTDLWFELQPKEHGTVLVFRHLGWRSTDGALGLCSFDWACYLLSLRALVEAGHGQPHAADG